MKSTNSSLHQPPHECILRDFVVVNLDVSLLEALQIMNSAGNTVANPLGSTCILVLDNQQLVGLLTERDLVRLAAQQRNLRDTKVCEVMTWKLITCREWEAREPMKLIQLLQQHRIRHLPVLNEQDQLVGLVTPSSIRSVLQPLDLLKCRHVREVMAKNVIHAPPTATVMELAQLMNSHHVSCVVIGDEVQPGKILPLGIVTERDIVQFQTLEMNLSKFPAQQLMSSPLLLVNPDDSLWETHQAMQQRNMRRFVVADKEGHLVGILTQTNIFQAVDVKELHKIIVILQEQVEKLENEKLDLLKRLNCDLQEQVSDRNTQLQVHSQRHQLLAAEKQVRFQAQLLAQVSDAVVAIDIAHRVIHWNTAAEKQYGIKAQEALGKPLNQCYEYIWIKPEDEANCNEALSTVGFWQGENIHRQLNGNKILVESSVSILKDEQGNNMGILALIRDISERVRLEIERQHAEQELKLKNLALEEAKQQAETANQAKSEFLANMSHEIRTPMNAILGFADLLQSQVTKPHIVSYIQAIISSGKTLLALINDILDLSKIEAGKLELYYEPVDLRGLIREIFQIFNPRATAQNLILRSIIEDTVPQSIYIDEVRLRQILFNVVGNALKFTDKGYIQISIRAHPYSTNEEEKIWLEIAVEDTGIGIDRKQQQSIFEAFFQSSGQSNRKYGGTGLGLAITKRLMNMMGGIITLQSELAKGSIFTFVFPAVSPATGLMEIVPELSQDDGLNQFAPSTILVADDVASNRELIKSYFQQTPHRILLVQDGQQAINLAQLHNPDLILLDLRMPRIDGKEAAQHLKQDEKTKNIPIVMLTASSQAQEQEELKQICQGFLSKPISCIQLVQELKKHLPLMIDVETLNQIDRYKTNTQAPQSLTMPINLSELLIKLQQEEEMIWNNLRKTLTMRALKKFIQRLNTWGQEHQCQLLIDYANSLQTKLDAFDMEQLPLIIEQFPSVRQAIEALI
ncbi:MAG: CBS domain-containing protein [Nostocales cyanobacterium]|nr:MAG: CBS domain-containing protein [Nostocales cyanobacterium]